MPSQTSSLILFARFERKMKTTPEKGLSPSSCSTSAARLMAPFLKSTGLVATITLSGPGGMIEVLDGISGPRKVLIHINNTNPILDVQSEEYGAVVQAGWQVAHDGWQLDKS